MDNETTPRRILGIDPGLNTTGYGVVDVHGRDVRIVEAGVVRSRARAPLADKVHEIYDGLVEVIQSLKPTTAALEELYSRYDRPRTAILMGHARGAICLAVVQADISLSHYSATQIKKILTGSGRAPKIQVQEAVQREFGLAEPPDSPDVADALAAALCHHYLAGNALSVR